MLRATRWRVVIILAVLGLSAWQLHHRGLTLGLDLRGGAHLVLQLDEGATRGLSGAEQAQAQERAVRVIRGRIDEFGVAEPLIQSAGNDRIIVELPGITDLGRATDIIQRAAFLELNLVADAQPLRAALSRLDRAASDALADDTDAPLADGADEPDGPFSARVRDTGRPGELVVAEEEVPRLRALLRHPDVQAALPRGTALVFGHAPEPDRGEWVRPLYVLAERTIITGAGLTSATAGRDPMTYASVVHFELNREAARVFDRTTAANIGERLAILLDGEVVSAPFIETRIAGRGRIDLGMAPLSEARDLALVLRAGALPVPLEVIEQRAVGPALGAEAIGRGRTAGVIAVVLLVGVIVAYYGAAGLHAVAGLAVYALALLGALAGAGATLTVPGMAGLILSLGMAVDANVLIFERIREEETAVLASRAAVHAGYRRAMSAIVDANLTTLVTALILFHFGTGPVRGFAVTLAAGIVASFFSAVFVTRTLMDLHLGWKLRRSAGRRGA